MLITSNITIILLLLCKSYFCYFNLQDDDDCFCQLQGKIDDCTCNIDTVDHFNNIKIYPRLNSLLQKDYFRFYKLNLFKKCPYWNDDSTCTIRFCNVETCHDDEIPPGLKGESKSKYIQTYTKKDCDHNEELGYLNTTISAKMQEDMVLWGAYDDAQDNFCLLDDKDNDAEYVDLFLNPERYTGYKGKSAHKIWHSIYMENCFIPSSNKNPYYIETSKINDMCLEERVFYRSISGLHTSINIHLCSKYLLSDTTPTGIWGPNLLEFRRRFSKESTNGEGPHWLRNLYFLFLLELRALNKASNYLIKEEFYTGNKVDDWDTQLAIKDLLKVIDQFSYHFNESTMFTNKMQKENLKYEFKQHFRNISRIMDCVGCDKCKLWGKLQVQGLGTALKILFSGKFDTNLIEFQPSSNKNKNFQLQRNEIVALLNSLGRLSTSIYELDEFRHLLK